MSISRQNLTAIIVTFKSENVIHNCIQSIGSDIEVLIIDNSPMKLVKIVYIFLTLQVILTKIKLNNT